MSNLWSKDREIETQQNELTREIRNKLQLQIPVKLLGLFKRITIFSLLHSTDYV